MTEPTRAALARRERLGDAIELCERVLLRLSRQGLTRLSRAAVAELRSLVQTAHNGHLVTLERTLEGLSTTVEHYLDRDPNFRATRYVERLNRAWWLLQEARKVHQSGADPSAYPAVLGSFRRKYVVQSEPLTVQSLGATGWVTDSGFVGITVHLRGPDRIYQLSNARPVEWFGNDPRRLLRYPLSDALEQTIEELSHGAWTLHGAKLSWDGRISVSGELSIEPAAWSGRVYDDLLIESWSEAATLLATNLSPLVGAPSRLLLIQPTRWSGWVVDERVGTAQLSLRDASDAPVTVEVPLRPENNLLIDNLQLLIQRKALRPPALFGRLRAAGGLRFEPFSAVYGQPRKLKERGRSIEVEEVHLGLEDLENLR